MNHIVRHATQNVEEKKKENWNLWEMEILKNLFMLYIKKKGDHK